MRHPLGEIKAFVTAPVRWTGGDWLRFGGVMAAAGVAYQYDNRVRSHFVAEPESSTAKPDRHDVEDAVPAALAFGVTWLAARHADNADGLAEAGAMLHAATLAGGTAFVLKRSIGRALPGQGAERNDWRSGGTAFPSGHTAVAFAIGTVLAESGDDRHRRLRRVLGYGIGIGTAYERLNHDAHWFSDTVAGAGLGIATARFVMNERNGTNQRGELMLLPSDGGAVLSYSVPLRR
jgi:membrane-associated phospholipid phosphatase